jgi:transcriptional regulator with XRE-family HTH domain
MVLRRKPQSPGPTGGRTTLNAHQIVAYNVRRARELAGWTQAETAERLAAFVGYDMRQAGISAIERTYDGERPRNIDIGEVVAFSRCFGLPIAWFLVPPPGRGAESLDPAPSTKEAALQNKAANLLAFCLGDPAGWQAYRDRIIEALETDDRVTWGALRLATGSNDSQESLKALDDRRQILLGATMRQLISEEDEVIVGLARLLKELLKLTARNFEKYRAEEPEELIARLAELEPQIQRTNRYTAQRDGTEPPEPVDLEALVRVKDPEM